MSQIPEMSELLKAGLHFGHQTARWHPKMKSYIFTVRNGIHIIDLEKTSEKLEEALTFVKKVVKNNGVILFLGTKPQAQEIVKNAALAAKMPYSINHWIGGNLTNFSQIKRLIEKYNSLKAKKESGELVKYTKKEQSLFDKEIERLEQMVGGMANLKKLPDAIFIIDTKQENTAVKEANRKKVPIIAICDTNSNPDLIDYPIPANDDGIKSIELIVNLVAETIKEASQEKEKDEKIEKEKEPSFATTPLAKEMEVKKATAGKEKEAKK
ncbi:MAG: 30S ribosomal protein S2 [bacterium]